MIVKLVDLYRHELFDNDFGVEFCEENDEQMTKTIDEENDENSADFRSTSNKQSRSIIIVKTVPPHSTRLPAHIWRSLAKIVPGDLVVEFNGISTTGQTVAEFEKNLKLSGNRIRLRLKSESRCQPSSLTQVDSTWPSSPMSTDHLDLKSFTNGYHSTAKSRSCENHLDTCGDEEKLYQDDSITISSSSLIDLPTSHADYDNLPLNKIDENKTTKIDLDEKIRAVIDARLKEIDDEFDSDGPVRAETVNKSVDLPSARRLAKRLYMLDGFRSTDVIRHLCKRNDFSQLVAEEYVKLFDFQGDTLDRALRKFVKQFTIIGEAQDRERVLHFFAARYLDCNPTTFSSVDACHMLTCAIMLLNTDLHDPKITNKMTFQQFSDNLHELNDGGDFSKDLLKSLYNAIKTEQLMDETTLASDDYNDVRFVGQGALHGYRNIVNPSLEISDTTKSVEYMQGYLMRKCCSEPDGKRTSFLRRGWKAYYASLRDLILYLHKNDDQPPTISIGDTNAIRLHHALAQEATDYRKRQHVFRLKTSDWAEYLFQTSDRELMLKWIEMINLIAASFSSPPLPAAIDSSSLRFQRPLLPSVQTRHSVFEQYDFILHQINEINRQLSDLKAQTYAQTTLNGDIKPLKACDMIENKDKIIYFQYELQRYETYADRLRRHFHQLQLDRNSIKISSNPDDENHSPKPFVPLESFSGALNHCQNALVSYKKSSQTAQISLVNANRYSYLMAVNSQPVTIKEQRL